MILMPALDLLGGRVVQLVGGERGTEQVALPDPLAVAQRWIDEGAAWLHVVDLGAAFGQRHHREVIRALLAEKRLRVQVGGGLRTEEQLQDYLGAGAARVVVGTKALRDPAWLRTMAHRYPDKIVLALDARDGNVVAHGWMKNTGRDLLEAAAAVQDLPLAAILHTAVHVEGRLQGIDRDGLARLLDASRLPVIASGGITTTADLEWLRDHGAQAAILGLALYTGRLKFQECLSIAETPT